MSALSSIQRHTTLKLRKHIKILTIVLFVGSDRSLRNANQKSNQRIKIRVNTVGAYKYCVLFNSYLDFAIRDHCLQ